MNINAAGADHGVRGWESWATFAQRRRRRSAVLLLARNNHRWRARRGTLSNTWFGLLGLGLHLGSIAGQKQMFLPHMCGFFLPAKSVRARAQLSPDPNVSITAEAPLLSVSLTYFYGFVSFFPPLGAPAEPFRPCFFFFTSVTPRVIFRIFYFLPSADVKSDLFWRPRKLSSRHIRRLLCQHFYNFPP